MKRTCSQSAEEPDRKDVKLNCSAPAPEDKPKVKCDLCPMLFQNNISLGLHRHKTHPKETNKERLEKMMNGKYLRRKNHPDVVDKSQVFITELNDIRQITEGEKKTKRKIKKSIKKDTKRLTKILTGKTKNTNETDENRNKLRPDLSSVLSKNQKETSLKKIWRKAFEKNRKRTVERILAGQDPHGETTVPEGSKEFWSELFNDGATNIRNIAERIKYKEDPRMASLSAETNIHEVRDILQKIKLKSAAGPDDITRGDIKEEHREKLTKLLNKIINNSYAPCSFKQCKMHLIPKKLRSQDPKDYRPLNVANMFRRVLSGILNLKTADILEPMLGQRGFRRGNEGCYINTQILTRIIKNKAATRKDLSFAFLDMRKAFDSIKHNELIKTLAKNGIPRKTLVLIADLYTNNIAELQNGDTIMLQRGVIQGDPLSPLLFNLMLDEGLNSIRGQGMVSFGKTEVGHIAFADDLVIFANNDEQLNQKIKVLAGRLQTLGLQINAEKSVTCHLVFPRSKYTINNEAEPCMINGVKIPQMECLSEYKYLGVTINTSGDKICPITIKSMNEDLQKIDQSTLKAQQKIEIIRDILTARALHHLDLSDATIKLMMESDRLFNKYVRKWLRLPHDCPKILINGTIANGGLGILSMQENIRGRRLDRYLRLNNADDDPYEGDKQVDELRKTIKHPKYAKIDEKKAMLATVDGKNFKNHWDCPYYKSKWVRDPPKWMSTTHFQTLIRTRANQLPTPARTSRGKAGPDGKKCPTCKNKIANLNHIISECPASQPLRTVRHDAICQMIVIRLHRMRGIKHIKVEPQIRSTNGELKKPDIIFQIPNTGVVNSMPKVVVMDPTITTINKNLNEAHEEKAKKYDIPSVHKYINQNYIVPTEMEFMGVALDWTGAWSCKSHLKMRKLGFDEAFLEAVSMETIYKSHMIFQKWKASHTQPAGSNKK